MDVVEERQVVRRHVDVLADQRNEHSFIHYALISEDEAARNDA
jgi:hypothetical protein